MLVTALDAHPIEVDDLDADGFLTLAADIETKERGAARDKLRLAAQWCAPSRHHRHLAERETKAKRTWGVRLSHGKSPDGYDGTSWIDATGDTLDLTRFHDYVCQVADQLRLEGDTDDLDLRKAKALGVIADQASPGPGAAAKTKLYLHLTLADLETGTGVGTVERLGPATRRLTRPNQPTEPRTVV